MSARVFEPVFLPAERAIDGRLSVTFGRHENTCSRAGFLYALHKGGHHENTCSRAGFLYALHKGGASSHEMERGSALHRVLELATLAAVENDQPMIPPELVKAIVNEVLADPAYRCPVEEHDYLRESAYRWAEEATFDASTLVACERMFMLEVGGFRLRGKIDRADLVDEGARLIVQDYKSSRAMPSYESLGRSIPSEGRVAPKDYQLVAYALLLAFGVPVREEPCPCQRLEPPPYGLPACTGCMNTGRLEIPEPFGVAPRAQRFELSYVFPGIDADGSMGRRDLEITRLELHEYLASFEAQMTRVRAAIESGAWPATESASGCSECPCERKCPIPRELRSYAGEVNTVEEATEAAERLSKERKLHQARWDEIKTFVKKQVPGQRLRFGRDQVIEPTTVVKRVIRDKEGMRAAIERARVTGEPFDLGEWEKEQVSTPIGQRTLTEDELVAEAAADTNNINSEGSR